MAGGDAAEVLQLGEGAFDEVALAVEPLAEARLPASVAFGRDVGRGAPVPDQLADAVSVVGLVGRHDGACAMALGQVAPFEVGQVISAHADAESEYAAFWCPLVDIRPDCGR